MLEEVNSYRNIIDYIFLLRIMKFSKLGLIKLFEKPSMEISHIKAMKKDALTKLLLTKRKSNLDYFNKISNLYDFDPNEEEYSNIEKLVKHCIQNDIAIITPFSKEIPKLLQILPSKNRDLVFNKGNIINDDLKSYSICGTRAPTKDAILKTNEIAGKLAQCKFTLINGFAKGIDIEAFKGANERNGRYIGVLASGVENVYPPENKKYVQTVIENGALISQTLIWNRVTKFTLQMRNRFSAQLSLGSIFIEGNYKSGTKWQYKFAKEAGRPTFYLEPKDWNHENTHVLKMIKDEGGVEIKNDLSNIETVIDILEVEYDKRMEAFKD
ncbi:MAG: DNA-processing protein DprA [Promethearchaeota archaeon]